MEDYICRMTAAGDTIRAFGAMTRNTVEKARAMFNTSPIATAALGRTLTGALMMGSMMKGDKDLVTVKFAGDGPIKSIIATADSFGHVKGCVGNGDVVLPPNAAGKLNVSGAIGNGSLTVIKDIGLKEPYSGTCELATGEIAEDLTYYFTASEQTPSSVGLGVLMNRGNFVEAAGGFIIQVMPDAASETIDIIEGNLSIISSVTGLLKDGMAIEDILRMILLGLDVKEFDRIPASYRCDCNRERVRNAIASIGKKDLQSLIDEGEDVSVECHFCDKKYTFSPEELKKLLFD